MKRYYVAYKEDGYENETFIYYMFVNYEPITEENFDAFHTYIKNFLSCRDLIILSWQEV